MTGLLPGPLYFATSSPAKLLQARLFLQSHGYRVEQAEYLAKPYDEMYGQTQERLLERALEQVRKRTNRPMLVFAEDTTVRVEALSGTADLPGQRAKEWFPETVHADLVAELDRRGGDLRAVIKSDLALSVPGLARPVHFHGEVAGEILRVPAPTRTNPLYPWLECRDFSGWFRPDGADRALGAMSYEESLRFDFRIRALEALAARLREYQAVLNLPPHCVTSVGGTGKGTGQTVIMTPRDDLILVVLGRPGAGKTTIGNHLEAHRGFVHVESSAVLPDAAAVHGCRNPVKPELARELFEVAGYGAVEEYAVRKRLLQSNRPVVYTGVRTLEGLAALLEHAEREGRTCRVVHVDVGERKAMYRYIDRARDDGKTPPLDYRTITRKDMEFGALPYARIVADWRLVNSGSLDGLHARLDRMLVSLAEGQTRCDRPYRPRLTAALCAASGHHDTPEPSLAWLRRQHPLLTLGPSLSSRGHVLHRILHPPST